MELVLNIFYICTTKLKQINNKNKIKIMPKMTQIIILGPDNLETGLSQVIKDLNFPLDVAMDNSKSCVNVTSNKNPNTILTLNTYSSYKLEVTTFSFVQPPRIRIYSSDKLHCTITKTEIQFYV